MATIASMSSFAIRDGLWNRRLCDYAEANCCLAIETGSCSRDDALSPTALRVRSGRAEFLMSFRSAKLPRPAMAGVLMFFLMPQFTGAMGEGTGRV
jgi:hypothetical protein